MGGLEGFGGIVGIAGDWEAHFQYCRYRAPCVICEPQLMKWQANKRPFRGVTARA